MYFTFKEGSVEELPDVTPTVATEKIKYSDVPAPLRGIGITFIITGLMAISFICFSGISL